VTKRIRRSMGEKAAICLRKREGKKKRNFGGECPVKEIDGKRNSKLGEWY